MIISRTKDAEELVVWDLISQYDNPIAPEDVDFTILDLTTMPSSYGRGGIKKYTDYMLGDKLAIRKSFNYTETEVRVAIKWFGYDGEVGLIKEITKPFGITDRANWKKSNRNRTIDFLQASSKGTLIESFVSDILRHYKTEIDLWIYNNTDDWDMALEAEPETINGNPNPIYSYLHIMISAPSEEFPNGLNVKENILLQIRFGD